jgi:hypothetical protein
MTFKEWEAKLEADGLGVPANTIGLLLADLFRTEAREKRLLKALADIMKFEKIDFPKGEATTYAYRVARDALKEEEREQA